MGNKKIIIWLKPYLLIKGTSISLIMVFLCLLFSNLISTGKYTETKQDALFCALLFIIMAIGAFIALFLCLPKWCTYIIIDATKKTIRHYSLFKCQKIETIHQYKYVYLTSRDYEILPSNLKHIPKYILLSNKKTFDFKLEHYKSIVALDNLVVMKFTKRRWKILKEILGRYE